jgi:membrane associated rhomboid family serine protease
MANKNGHDDSDDPKITRFPDARERREMEHRLKAANDRATKSEPILNLPPVIKAICLFLIAVQVPLEILKFMADDRPGAAEDTYGAIYDWVINNLGFFVPRYSGDMPFGWQGIVSPFSYMALHGNFLHLGMNLAMFAAFGAGLERGAGGKRLIAIFLTTGVIAAFTHAALYVVSNVLGYPGLFPDPGAPLIGASGGISGVVGAVIVMARDKGLLNDFLKGKITKPVIAIIASILLLGIFGMPGAGGPIAWMAHLGGFIAGLLLYRPFARLKW